MNRNTKPSDLPLTTKALVALFCSLMMTAVSAQSLNDVKWKDQQQVRNLFGEPQKIRGPVGTHANYSLWEYSDFTVAFSNQRAFHLFRKDSLISPSLNEKRR